MAQLDNQAPRNPSLVRKVTWTMLSGFIAFSSSALLDNVLNISLADQLVLTAITGGVALLIQYLADFEQRLRGSEEYLRGSVSELQNSIQQGFAGVSEATALMEDLERSALPKDALKQVVRRTALITGSTSALVRGLAESEIERISGTLRALGDGHEVFYEGEDRELLLSLARRATTSILATSWATVSTHGAGFEAGFWLTDLGGRYLDLQRAAHRRRVMNKRIFIYEAPDIIESQDFKHILAMQQSAGVEVRLLGGGPLPPDGSVTDFVLFDGEVSYDTTPVTRGGPYAAPWLLTTRLVLDREKVRNRILRFEELWDAATEPPDLARSLPKP
jgi:hypothetical protein